MDIRLGSSGVTLNNGKLELTSGRGEALAQRLRIRLRTFYQSWFLNTNYGVDYFNRVFEKGIPKSSIDALFQSEINKDVRVEKILDFKSAITSNVYTLSFKVRAKDGLVSDQIDLSISPSEIKINV